ncbi:hydrogenase nickel incorporation protein HypB [Thioalkalivibrio paradoxus]|uniref:hydrogenase nickel incorporation protein HypB n=1 Tax=Thioalkalivibrio paradoxus TaxID=108010 RepID=UPI0022B37DCD|nr:hydrogenase nickel incorporation protein HypB [Thioalkalivibrio paradoxus]
MRGHEHEHRHADGTVHSHPHDHSGAHGHGAAHEHSHEHRHADGTVHRHPHDHAGAPAHGHHHHHEHVHEHADGTVHVHVHDHGGEHGHGAEHDHLHRHAHSHRHADGTVHAHAHDHASEHGHGAGHDHGHGQPHHHEHRHADGTVHSHPHDHDNAHHGHGTVHAAEAGPDGELHYGRGAAHAHAPGMTQERMVRIEQDILGKNNAYARSNREHFRRHGILALNLVSSPGSGKTSLLAATIERLQNRYPVSVIEGDQQTSHDAERIRATGAPAVQVNTGKGCHLDALMVGHAVEHLKLDRRGLLLIENVGNLVCPSAFDLGEAHKVVILSVTEGEDKPLKYPDMFHASDLMILNKTDLLPYVDFDVARCIDYARRVNPELEVLQVSARTGEGMDAWIAWLNRAMGQDAGAESAEEELESLRRRVAELEAQLQEARQER